MEYKWSKQLYVGIIVVSLAGLEIDKKKRCCLQWGRLIILPIINPRRIIYHFGHFAIKGVSLLSKVKCQVFPVRFSTAPCGSWMKISIDTNSSADKGMKKRYFLGPPVTKENQKFRLYTFVVFFIRKLGWRISKNKKKS